MSMNDDVIERLQVLRRCCEEGIAGLDDELYNAVDEPWVPDVEGFEHMINGFDQVLALLAGPGRERMKAPWNQEDIRAAAAFGFLISSSGGTKLIRTTFPESRHNIGFPSDADAAEYVYRCAEKGAGLHRRAIRHIILHPSDRD